MACTLVWGADRGVMRLLQSRRPEAVATGGPVTAGTAETPRELAGGRWRTVAHAGPGGGRPSVQNQGTPHLARIVNTNRGGEEPTSSTEMEP